MRRTCVWSTANRTSTIASISSPFRRASCATSWWTTPARTIARSAAPAVRRSRWTKPCWWAPRCRGASSNWTMPWSGWLLKTSARARLSSFCFSAASLTTKPRRRWKFPPPPCIANCGWPKPGCIANWRAVRVFVGSVMAAPASPERWRRLEELFNQALELEPEKRRHFLDTACGDDAGLREEIESLLRSSTTEGADFIEEPLRAAARDFYADQAPAPLAEGSRVSHYRILSTLGAGGMGRVYLAEDARLGRKVALKTLAPGRIHGARALSRFEQEARAASALNHPNILTIYEVGRFEGANFIASEFVDGATLRERLAEGRLDADATLEIAIQVAAGLSAAHAAHIEHRDIKPENIILREDGLLKIVDFGIAKLSREATGEEPRAGVGATATLPGMVLGTARYMSPEQARGLQVDGRTDVFSLGTMLYEMLAGRLAFEGETASDVIAEILKSDPPP